MTQTTGTLKPVAAGKTMASEQVKTEVFYLLVLHKGKVAIQEDDSQEFGKIVKPFSKSIVPEKNYNSDKMEDLIFQELIKFHLGEMKIENLNKTVRIHFPVKAKNGVVKNFHVLIVAENNFHKFNGTFHFIDLEKLKKINHKKSNTRIDVHGTMRSVTPGFQTALFLYRP